MGFSNLTGIDSNMIQDWGVNSRLSATSSLIYEKLIKLREESLSNKLTVVKNPVGVLAILNRHYQWNLPGVSREGAHKQSLGAAELPKLGQNNGDFQDLPSNCTIVENE